MPQAVVIGTHPAWELAGCYSHPHDGWWEMELYQAIAGEPGEVVKCKTVDLVVPADVQGVDRPRPDHTQRRGAPRVEFGPDPGPVASDRAPGHAVKAEPVPGRQDLPQPIPERTGGQVEAGEQPAQQVPKQPGAARGRCAIGRWRQAVLEQVPGCEDHPSAQAVGRVPDRKGSSPQPQPKQRLGREIVGEMQPVGAGREPGHAAGDQLKNPLQTPDFSGETGR